MALPTVEEVLAAYRETGMLPIDGGWSGDGRDFKTCCPLTAVCLVRDPSGTRALLDESVFDDERFRAHVGDVATFVCEVDNREDAGLGAVGCEAIRAAEREFGRKCPACYEWLKPGEECECVDRQELDGE